MQSVGILCYTSSTGGSGDTKNIFHEKKNSEKKKKICDELPAMSKIVFLHISD